MRALPPWPQVVQNYEQELNFSCVATCKSFRIETLPAAGSSQPASGCSTPVGTPHSVTVPSSTASSTAAAGGMPQHGSSATGFGGGPHRASGALRSHPISSFQSASALSSFGSSGAMSQLAPSPPPPSHSQSPTSQPQQPQQLQLQQQRTLMVFDGCTRGLAATVLLKGDDIEQLSRLKRVVMFASLAAYHLRIENIFLAEQLTAATASGAAEGGRTGLAVSLVSLLPCCRDSPVHAAPCQLGSGPAPACSQCCVPGVYSTLILPRGGRRWQPPGPSTHH
jgi:hypothetical protein